MAEPTLSDFLRTGGSPFGNLEMRYAPGLTVVDGDPTPPGPAWGGLMPQSEEERRHYGEDDRERALIAASWVLPPVSAYLGGRRLAQGVAEGQPLNALLGAGQIGFAMPGVWDAAMGAARMMPNRLWQNINPLSARERMIDPRVPYENARISPFASNWRLDREMMAERDRVIRWLHRNDGRGE